MAIPLPPGSKTFEERSVRAWAQQLLAGAGLNFGAVVSDSGTANADQSGDTLGIIGGQGITTSVNADNVTITIDTSSTTTQDTIDYANDTIVFYDDSASAGRKTHIGNLDVSQLDGYDSNAYIDHSSVVLTTTGGITGGGDITASRALKGAHSAVELELGYAATENDRGKVLHYTGSGAVTLEFDTAANLGDGWFCIVRNDSSGTITLDPSSSELINTAETLAVLTLTGVMVFCNGTEFYTIG